MWSSESAPPISLELRPSAWLAALTAATHLAAGLVLWLAPLPLWMRLCASLAVLASIAGVFHAKILQAGPRAVRSFVWKSQGEWLLTDGCGRVHRAELLPASYVSAWLIVLCWRTSDGRRLSATLLPDSGCAATRRRLAARLAQGRAHGPI